MCQVRLGEMLQNEDFIKFLNMFEEIFNMIVKGLDEQSRETFHNIYKMQNKEKKQMFAQEKDKKIKILSTDVTLEDFQGIFKSTFTSLSALFMFTFVAFITQFILTGNIPLPMFGILLFCFALLSFMLNKCLKAALHENKHQIIEKINQYSEIKQEYEQNQENFEYNHYNHQ